MGKLLETIFGSKGMSYEEALAEQKRRRGASARSLSDIIGSAEVPAGSPLQPKPASGRFAGAGTEQTMQLQQLKDMLGSGDLTLQKLAMDEFAEFSKPVTKTQYTDPSSYKEFMLTNPEGTGKEYADFLSRKNRALGGIGGGMKISELAKIGIKNAEGVIRPIENVSLTALDIENKVGLAEGESYVPMPASTEMDFARTYQKVKLAFSEMDELAFLGDDAIFSEDYTADPGSQLKGTIAHMTQSDPRLAQYTGMIKGVAGQFARIVGGEKGALREEDIQRVVDGLFPQIAHVDMSSGLPRFVKGDTRSVALRKRKFLKTMLQMSPSKMDDVLADELKKLDSGDDGLMTLEELLKTKPFQ